VSKALYTDAVLIDTSACVAAFDEEDALHLQATATLAQLAAEAQVLLCAVNVTAHESFTRIRYNARLDAGIDGYSWMRSEGLQTIQFADADEVEALSLIRKYSSVKLSFHDALCAAVMLRLGIYRIFSFDADFWTFGFELIPGVIQRR
jgi:predicted nucleic acid-binding protein